ncbi:PG0541 family transporter-associated protein [Alkaliflexus imshenetskii]|uniref:PG0541 family transporter-associated protein n=1 Tax=Alkaliflexus imshenetskii TaxID=286730 RepID=UPI00047D17AF|nr:PG0541 family transporter-associated protein [Alkaliflexus imshenetskii]
MKAVFIAYNQALTEKIEFILDRMSIRGFTRWNQVQGRGSHTGEPHMGTHTWPAMNETILTIVPDEKVNELMDKLRHLDSKTEMQGLRAYVWSVEDAI